MRIAHLTCVFPPYAGGIGRVAYELAARQAEFHQVEVFTPLYKETKLTDSFYKFKVNYLASSYQLGKAVLVPDILARLKGFDIVHLHYPWFGAHEFLNKLDKKTKLVITYHMAAKSAGWKQILFSLDDFLFAKHLSKRADCLLVATVDYLKNVALPNFGEPEKWRVLPFGVDQNYYPGSPSFGLQNKLGIIPSDRILIFVGTLDKAHEFKGLPVLLKSLKQIQDSAVKLLIVGDGDMKQSYEALAQSLDLSDRVRFVGYIPENDLPDYYRLASVMVFPSLTAAEAFGLVAVQAMACALPVVASDLAGVRQVVQNNVNGLLVPAGQADELAISISKLVNNQGLAKQFGQAGRQMVLEKYQWDDIVKKLEGIYRQLM